MPTTMKTPVPSLQEAIENLEIALPAEGDGLEQDEESIVVRVEGAWMKIRLHDYNEVFPIQGLYEKWVYKVLQCGSPAKIRELLGEMLKRNDTDPANLTVLDLGAGNGVVAEELAKIGIREFVGVDLYQEAADAAERDRPGLYGEFVVGDLLDLPVSEAGKLEGRTFDCLACVAALGFGDIPPVVFASAYNRVRDGGWAAFTIKSDFLDPNDDSGFSTMIRGMIAEKVVDPLARERYTHRVSPTGSRLEYTAIIGRKMSDIPDSLIPSQG